MSVRRRARNGLRNAFRACSGGQTVVEFLLVAPMLLVLFFGIVEFGNGWRRYQLVTNTAREGCRVAVLPSGTAPVVSTVINDRLNASGLDASQASVTLAIRDPGDPGYFGSADTVTVDYPHDFVFLGPLIDLMCAVAGCDGSVYGTITLSSSAVMRNE